MNTDGIEASLKKLDDVLVMLRALEARTPSRQTSWLDIGDRACLWFLAIMLAAGFIWHDYEAEHNSPQTLDPSPACHLVPAPKLP